MYSPIINQFTSTHVLASYQTNDSGITIYKMQTYNAADAIGKIRIPGKKRNSIYKT